MPNLKSQKLTKSLIEELKPKQKDYFVWDSELRGFGVKVTPTGRKIFVAQYRIAGVGISKRKTIGIHGEVHVQKAKEETRDVLHDARKGIDPNAEREALKKAPTISKALDAFFDEHVNRHLKPSTVENYQLMRRVHLEPAFGKFKLSDITRECVAKFHAKYQDEPYGGNKLLAILSKFFNWCEQKELITLGANPCKHIQKFKEPSRERFLSSSEIKRLLLVLDTATDEKLATTAAVNAIRLLMLTGARRNEILTLRWDFIDLTQHVINLPDSKTGKKTIMLSDTAVKLLRTIERNSNPYVISGQNENTHLVNIKSAWQRIRKAAGLEDVRLHDLRHTYASMAINNGVPLELISKLLGHKQLKTTLRYAHLQNDTLKMTANLVDKGIG